MNGSARASLTCCPRASAGFAPSTDAGRTLWRRESIHQSGNFVPIRTQLHGELLAANLVPYGHAMSQADSYLDLLDPQTGQSVERLLLPSGHQLFEGFADSYGAWIDAVDLDSDGYDEVVVSFGHSPYYPSYNVFVEPDRQDMRLVFASAGHHRLAGTVDLDGDGRRELLLGGINNRLGWASGLAAVRVPVRLRSRGTAIFDEVMALAPDLFQGIRPNTNLLWYELLPPPLLFYERWQARGRCAGPTPPPRQETSAARSRSGSTDFSPAPAREAPPRRAR